MAYRKSARRRSVARCPHHPGNHRPARSRHQAVDQAVARRAGVAALAGLRHSLPRHERVLAVDGRRHVRLRLAVLDDLQPGQEPWRPGPQGREVDDRDLLQELHQGGRSARYRREERRGPPRAEGLSGVQCRSGRGAARALPSGRRRSISSSPKAARPELDAFFAAIPASAAAPGRRGLLRARRSTASRCRRRTCSPASITTTRRSPMSCRTGPAMPAVSAAISRTASAPPPMPPRNWSRNCRARCSAPNSVCRWRTSTATPATSSIGSSCCKDDDRAILTAAAKAEEASSLLLKLGGRGGRRAGRRRARRRRARGLREDVMGRSVSYPSGAIVAFTVLEVEER